MAGHSKWHNIKHKKAKEDAIKGKAFTKLSKEITVSVRASGSELSTNIKLRLLLDKAKEINMPKDTIERAIKKGAGQLEGVNYEQIVYEGYGPENVALMVEALSDNKNRTASDIRHFFNKFGGRLGESGSVAWMFDHKGVVEIANQNYQEDDLLEKLLDFNVEDIQISDDVVRLISAIVDSESIRAACENFGFKVKEIKLEWIAQNPLALNDEQEDKVIEFLHRLEEMEDIQEIYTNLG